jgi:hypothetical protein
MCGLYTSCFLEAKKQTHNEKVLLVCFYMPIVFYFATATDLDAVV